MTRDQIFWTALLIVFVGACCIFAFSAGEVYGVLKYQVAPPEAK